MASLSFYTGKRPYKRFGYEDNLIHNETSIVYINSGIAEDNQIKNFFEDFLRKFLKTVENPESYYDCIIYINVVRGSYGKKNGYSYVYISDKRIYNEIMKYSLACKEMKINRGKYFSQYIFAQYQIKEYEEMKFSKMSSTSFSSKNLKNYDFCKLSPPGQLEINKLRTLKKPVKNYLKCDRIPFPIKKEDIVNFFEPFKLKHDGFELVKDKYPLVRFEEDVCFLEFDPKTYDVLFFVHVFKKVVIIPKHSDKFCMFNLVEE